MKQQPAHSTLTQPGRHERRPRQPRRSLISKAPHAPISRTGGQAAETGRSRRQVSAGSARSEQAMPVRPHAHLRRIRTKSAKLAANGSLPVLCTELPPNGSTSLVPEAANGSRLIGPDDETAANGSPDDDDDEEIVAPPNGSAPPKGSTAAPKPKATDCSAFFCA